MPDIGNHGQKPNPDTPGYTRGIYNNPHMITVTMGEAGTSTSIWAFLDVTGTHNNLRAAIYDTSRNLIDRETSPITVTTSDDNTWVEIPLDGAGLSDATDYIILVWIEDGADVVSLFYGASGGDYANGEDERHERHWNGTDYNDPADTGFPSNVNNRAYALYLEYSTAAPAVSANDEFYKLLLAGGDL